MIHVIELTSVIAGFAMIVGQCIMAECGDKLMDQYRNIKRLLFRRRSNHIYDNLPFYQAHQRNK